MELLQKNVQRAKANKQRIVLPEGLEPRTLQAADRIIADGIAHIILLGNPAEIQAKAAELGSSTLTRLRSSIRKITHAVRLIVTS